MIMYPRYKLNREHRSATFIVIQSTQYSVQQVGMGSNTPYKLSYCKVDRASQAENVELQTIPDYLSAYHKSQPEKEAVVFVFTNGSREAVTFKDLYENSVHVAKCLVKLGVKKTEFVAVSMRHCSEWLYAVFGAVLAGARPVSLSFTYTDGSDVVAMMKKLQTCSLFVLDPGEEEENWAVFRKLVEDYDKTGSVKSKKMPYLRYLICHDRPKDNNDILTLRTMMSWEMPDVDLPKAAPDDIFALFQTSGSTGVPKAVAHTHHSFIVAAQYFTDSIMPRADEIHFNDRPFTWIGGFPLTVITGHTRVTRSGYDKPPADTLGFLIDVIKREKCTNMLILPPLLNSFLERQSEIPSQWPLESVITGGQPLSKHFSNCIGKICKKFYCVYGSTEFLLCACKVVEKCDDFSENSAGYPMAGVEMKIVNDREEVVPIYEKGEIYIKIDCLFKSYYNDPEKTKACIAEDGWYRSDDVGFMNEDGMFFCVGRKSEMILSAGFNVAPAILETVLENHPAVARAICVPVPHPILFQEVCACVILEDGSGVTEAHLRTYCEEVHNDKKGMFTVLPTYFMFMSEFPQTYTGKTSRKELTRIATEKFVKA